MSAFIVATVHISNPDAFGLYAKGIAGLCEQYDGEYVVRGAVTDVFEGDSVVGERVVIIRFPTGDKARAFINSTEYQSAKQHRIGAADVVMRLIEL